MLFRSHLANVFRPQPTTNFADVPRYSVLCGRLPQQATRGYASQAAAVRAPRQLDGLAGTLKPFHFDATHFESTYAPPLCCAADASTGKYASSAYVAALSKDAKTLEKVEADLKSVQSALAGAEGAKLKTFIANPTLSGADRTKGLDQLLSSGKSKADRKSVV